jgi:hypothetical protein
MKFRGLKGRFDGHSRISPATIHGVYNHKKLPGDQSMGFLEIK